MKARTKLSPAGFESFFFKIPGLFNNKKKSKTKTLGTSTYDPGLLKKKPKDKNPGDSHERLSQTRVAVPLTLHTPKLPMT